MDTLSIDFVIPWVDGTDPEWQKEKQNYLGEDTISSDDRVSRYRDWGLLKYLFRGVAQCAPWVHKVFFVTNGQIPEWINLAAPKLVHVRHSDYMPLEYLPTFNSNSIEINLHRLRGLSEHFVYFNDDFFLLQPIKPEFFFRNGLPVLSSELLPIIARPGSKGMANIYLNDMTIINDRFTTKEIVRNGKNWFSPRTHSAKAILINAFLSNFNYCPGFRNPHFAVPVWKSTIEYMWDKEPEILDATSRRRFRDPQDVSQYLFRYWQYATNQFIAEKSSRIGYYYEIKNDNTAVCKLIREKRYPQICLNDMDLVSAPDHVQKVKEELIAAFNDIFPEKCIFEK